METVQDFINQLNKLTYIKYEDKTLHTEEGFEIYYEIKLMGGRMSKYPLQFIFRVRKENVHITSWGCGSNDDNILANCWWQSKESYIYDLEHTELSKKKAEFFNQFKQLTL